MHTYGAQDVIGVHISEQPLGSHRARIVDPGVHGAQALPGERAQRRHIGAVRHVAAQAVHLRCVAQSSRCGIMHVSMQLPCPAWSPMAACLLAH